MHVSDADLEAALLEGESVSVERKESLAGNTLEEICKAICAFSNDIGGTGRTGLLFVGVKDKTTEASGFVPDDNELRKLTDLKSDGRIVPPPSILIERRQVRGLDLAVVTVVPLKVPPVRFKGTIWVRNGPAKSRATAEEEVRLNERRRHLDTPFDTRAMQGVGVDALSLLVFEQTYLPSAFSEEDLAENGRSIEQRLAATRMIASVNEPLATTLGILVIGKAPQEYVPGAYVQFLRINGTELSDPVIDEARIEGTVEEVLRRTEDKLGSQIIQSIQILATDREIRSQSYPIDALRQLLRNAVLHRSYEGTNAPIRVTWFNDRVEIQNPGGPFGQVTKATFGQPGVTDYRNPSLADAMRVLGFVQRFGVGIATARRLLRDQNHPELEFRVEDSHVLAIVKGRLT